MYLTKTKDKHTQAEHTVETKTKETKTYKHLLPPWNGLKLILKTLTVTNITFCLMT